MSDTYEERVSKILDEFRSLSDEELDEMRGIHRVKDFNGTLRNYPSTINVFEEPESMEKIVTRDREAFRKVLDEMLIEERSTYHKATLQWSNQEFYNPYH